MEENNSPQSGTLNELQAPIPATRGPYEVYSQALDDREHGRRELAALVEGTPNFTPHYYAVSKAGLAIAVNIGGRNAAKDIPFLAHAANCHHDLLEALKELADEATSIGQHISCQAGMQAARFGETIERARAAIGKASAPQGTAQGEARSEPKSSEI